MGILVALLFAAGGTGCHGPTEPDGPRIETSEITAMALPLVFDPARTYVYWGIATPDPDALLRQLWLEGLPVVQAWMPLDNLCMDPRGPHFTIELTRPDARMEAHAFRPEAPRLHCARRLRHYLIRP